MLEISSLREASHPWYSKLSVTGLIMNYHALTPKKYKCAVVTEFVHRIYRACSGWKNIHDSLEKAKMKRNQYRPDYFEPIICDTLTQIVSPEMKGEKTEEDETLH